MLATDKKSVAPDQQNIPLGPEQAEEQATRPSVCDATAEGCVLGGGQGFSIMQRLLLLAFPWSAGLQELLHYKLTGDGHPRSSSLGR